MSNQVLDSYHDSKPTATLPGEPEPKDWMAQRSSIESNIKKVKIIIIMIFYYTHRLMTTLTVIRELLSSS